MARSPGYFLRLAGCAPGPLSANRHVPDCLQVSDLVMFNTVFNQMTGLVEALINVIMAMTYRFSWFERGDIARPVARRDIGLFRVIPDLSVNRLGHRKAARTSL